MFHECPYHTPDITHPYHTPDITHPYHTPDITRNFYMLSVSICNNYKPNILTSCVNTI